MDNKIARFISDATTSEATKGSETLLEDILFDKNLIDALNGPAILTDESLNISQKNIYADKLAAAFQSRDPAIHGLVIRCMTNKCPENQKIILEDDTGTQHYDLFAFPVNSNGDNKTRVLLFGKDITVEQQLTKALIESRQMFKDLVSCSTDFAWETDNKGCFKYVSPNGILGYTAYELNEKRAADLIVGQDGINPFDTLDAIHDVEIWLQRSDASFACVQVSANPIIDNNSTWQGARGVCRDITHIREREAALRRIRKSEQVLKKIISTIRDEVDPARVLETTAIATLDGIAAKHCYISQISSNEDGTFSNELKAQSGTIDDPEFYDKIIKKTLCVCEKDLNKLPPSYIEENIDGRQVLIGFSKHHNKVNGTIFIITDDQNKVWDKDEKSLFLGVTSHLGIALEQIKNYQQLEKLSNTDELTSLFNRRAFVENAQKRLIIQKRQQQTCALLYIDLDNFKQVNDTFGHARGDEVLKKISSILISNTRTEDLCCRLGGDEFAIWLENVNEESALIKAKQILNCKDELSELADNKEHPLSLSIGIALSHPTSNLSLDSLMELADNALYDVKKKGKSDVLLNQ